MVEGARSPALRIWRRDIDVHFKEIKGSTSSISSLDGKLCREETKETSDTVRYLIHSILRTTWVTNHTEYIGDSKRCY